MRFLVTQLTLCLLGVTTSLGSEVSTQPSVRLELQGTQFSHPSEVRAVLENDSGAQIWLEPTSLPQYYPAVHTTFWIEYRLWGLDPRGYHATNVGLHVISTLLLALAASRLRIPGALFAAAVFALHPVHVESVAWITERKNTLSLVFTLLSLLAWLRWRPLGGGRAGAIAIDQIEGVQRVVVSLDAG